MLRIEVVIAGERSPQVKELFHAAGARRFTGLAGVSGLGHDGYREGRLAFNERASLELQVTVVDDGHADRLTAGLELREAEHGVMFASDTYVSRPGCFR